MNKMTLDDLTGIMREAAGEDDSRELEGEIMDTQFADLGYDSLAILETAGLIQIAYEVVLDDSSVFDAATPRDLIDLVNNKLNDSASSK